MSNEAAVGATVTHTDNENRVANNNLAVEVAPSTPVGNAVEIWPSVDTTIRTHFSRSKFDVFGPFTDDLPGYLYISSFSTSFFVVVLESLASIFIRFVL